MVAIEKTCSTQGPLLRVCILILSSVIKCECLKILKCASVLSHVAKSVLSSFYFVFLVLLFLECVKSVLSHFNFYSIKRPLSNLSLLLHYLFLISLSLCIYIFLFSLPSEDAIYSNKKIPLLNKLNIKVDNFDGQDLMLLSGEEGLLALYLISNSFGMGLFNQIKNLCEPYFHTFCLLIFFLFFVSFSSTTTSIVSRRNFIFV